MARRHFGDDVVKLYCKVKIDGKWKWVRGSSTAERIDAQAMCECTWCRPTKLDLGTEEE
jgi:hypothetical protein